MICLDTNIVIHAINGRRPDFGTRIKTIIQSSQPLFLPLLVLHELEYGAAKSARPEHTRSVLRMFLGHGIEIIDMDAEDVSLAAIIRASDAIRRQPIGHNDLFIGTQALRRDATLITLNTREFMRIHGLRLDDWSS